MPVYVYHCCSCDKKFEKLQSMKDPPVTKCDLCGSDKAEKVIAVSNFVLAEGGVGWAKSGYSGS